jgi:hypothetical protein
VRQPQLKITATFSGLAGNATSSTTAPKGTISGALTDFSAGVSDGTGKLTFTSTATGATAAFVMSSAAPKLAIAPGQVRLKA